MYSLPPAHTLQGTRCCAGSSRSLLNTGKVAAPGPRLRSQLLICGLGCRELGRRDHRAAELWPVTGPDNTGQGGPGPWSWENQAGSS